MAEPINIRGRACETCEWWTADGECRRWPPSYRQTWPQTQRDHWCGEWRLAREAGEVETMMRVLAIMEGGAEGGIESYTDKGRRDLKKMAELWLSVMRSNGLLPIIVTPADA